MWRWGDWRAQSPKGQGWSTPGWGENLSHLKTFFAAIWGSDEWLMAPLQVEKKIIIKPEVVSLKYIIHVKKKIKIFFSNALKKSMRCASVAFVFNRVTKHETRHWGYREWHGAASSALTTQKSKFRVNVVELRRSLLSQCTVSSRTCVASCH